MPHMIEEADHPPEMDAAGATFWKNAKRSEDPAQEVILQDRVRYDIVKWHTADGLMLEVYTTPYTFHFGLVKPDGNSEIWHIYHDPMGGATGYVKVVKNGEKCTQQVHYDLKHSQEKIRKLLDMYNHNKTHDALVERLGYWKTHVPPTLGQPGFGGEYESVYHQGIWSTPAVVMSKESIKYDAVADEDDGGSCTTIEDDDCDEVPEGPKRETLATRMGKLSMSGSRNKSTLTEAERQQALAVTEGMAGLGIAVTGGDDDSSSDEEEPGEEDE